MKGGLVLLVLVLVAFAVAAPPLPPPPGFGDTTSTYYSTTTLYYSTTTTEYYYDNYYGTTTTTMFYPFPTTNYGANDDMSDINSRIDTLEGEINNLNAKVSSKMDILQNDIDSLPEKIDDNIENIILKNVKDLSDDINKKDNAIRNKIGSIKIPDLMIVYVLIGVSIVMNIIILIVLLLPKKEKGVEVPESVIKYVKACRARRMTDEQIKSVLISSGYNNKEVEKALLS